MLLDSAVLSLACSRDSELLACGDKDGRIKVLLRCFTAHFYVLRTVSSLTYLSSIELHSKNEMHVISWAPGSPSPPNGAWESWESCERLKKAQNFIHKASRPCLKVWNFSRYRSKTHVPFLKCHFKSFPKLSEDFCKVSKLSQCTKRSPRDPRKPLENGFAGWDCFTRLETLSQGCIKLFRCLFTLRNLKQPDMIPGEATRP